MRGCNTRVEVGSMRERAQTSATRHSLELSQEVSVFSVSLFFGGWGWSPSWAHVIISKLTG